MGAESSKMNVVTINGGSKEGGKWCIFKSARAGLLTVRNYGTESSVLNLWAPPDAVGHSFDGKNREATLSLVRAINDETESEFIDIYNQDYESCGREAGIRIQKRGKTTSFPNFKIEFSDGVKLHEAMRFVPPGSDDESVPPGSDDESKPKIEIISEVSLLNNKLSGLALPEHEDDAANKAYVDQNVNKSSIYTLQEEQFIPTPILQSTFFEINDPSPGCWQGILKSGFYKFNLNFVYISHHPTNPKFVILKLMNRVVLCQRLTDEAYEKNSVTCGLEVDEEASFSINFASECNTCCVTEFEICTDIQGLNRTTFLLEITKIK